MLLHLPHIERSKYCQYAKLQRLCKVFTRKQDRRQYGVDGRHRNFLCRNVCIKNVIFDRVKTSQMNRLCKPLCSWLHTTCKRRQKDYYKILHLTRNASASEIKSAYFRLSKKYHPDLNKGASSASFLDIVEAYEILGKTSTRQEYNDSISYKTTNQHQKTYDYDKFYSRPKHWNVRYENEANVKRKMKYPFDFEPQNFNGKEEYWKEEELETGDYMYSMIMCVLAAVILYAVLYDTGSTSRNLERDPSVKMTKLESGALVPSVDLAKKGRVSQCETKI